jgi:hypothetical protein
MDPDQIRHFLCSFDQPLSTWAWGFDALPGSTTVIPIQILELPAFQGATRCLTTLA